MEIEKALSQISEIHAQVLKTETFRGYRAGTMAVTGGIAILAAAVQATLLRPEETRNFVLYWVSVACLCALICGADIYWRMLLSQQWAGRLKTILVVCQSLPALVVGGVVTAVFLRLPPPMTALLPGLWALVYALGIFASRPYLPRAVGWVAAYFVLMGVQLLVSAGAAEIPSPWGMGLTFGIGQAALAVVLHLNLERDLDTALWWQRRRPDDEPRS